MPGLQEASRMLEGAEQAAIAADFESADELLRSAARIQEEELGPVHPDLANTLNNLAIVAEKAGRLDEAETYYRRAVAIAVASLPDGHPMIAASRENLEAFCRAQGLPGESSGAATSPAPAAARGADPDPEEAPAAPGSDATGEASAPPFAVSSATGEASAAPIAVSNTATGGTSAAPIAEAIGQLVEAIEAVPTSPEPPPGGGADIALVPTQPPIEAAAASSVATAKAPETDRPRARPRAGTRVPVAPISRPRRVAPRAVAGIALGFVAVFFALLLIWRPWTARDLPDQASSVAATPPAVTPAPPGAAESVPAASPGAQARPPSAAPPVADHRAGSSPSADVPILAAVELCRTFSTGGDGWRCDPAGAQVAPGPIVLYTRVRSASDVTVVHRWYRGEALVQAVRLRTQANAKQGYRTYSRQTVESGDWRVEVRSAAGALLHEARFAVR